MSYKEMLNYDSKILNRYLPNAGYAQFYELGTGQIYTQDQKIITFGGPLGAEGEPPVPSSGISKTDGVNNFQYYKDASENSQVGSEIYIANGGTYEITLEATVVSSAQSASNTVGLNIGVATQQGYEIPLTDPFPIVMYQGGTLPVQLFGKRLVTLEDNSYIVVSISGCSSNFVLPANVNGSGGIYVTIRKVG